MMNKQVRLAARPSELPTASDWAITSEPVPAPGPGQFVVAVSHVSVDPVRTLASSSSPPAQGDARRAHLALRADLAGRGAAALASSSSWSTR